MKIKVLISGVIITQFGFNSLTLSISQSNIADLLIGEDSPISQKRVQYNLIQPNMASVKKNIWYASIALCNDNLLKDWSCKSCQQVPDTKFVAMFGNFFLATQGYIAIDNQDKSIVLSFRNTENLINVLSNFIAIQGEFQPLQADLEGKDARVHNGFLGAMESLSEDFIRIIKGLLEQKAYKKYKIKVIGHSLGGSMSVLAAIKLQYVLKLDWSQLEVFTYGQPRTGNWQFAQWLNSKPLTIARTVNFDDTVPRLPSTDLFNYAHHGNELFIDPYGLYNGTRYCDQSILEDPTCAFGVSDIILNNVAHDIYFNTKLSKTFSC